MIGGWFSRAKRDAPRGERKRIRLDQSPSLIYAIGDVHGCLAQLRELEALIEADAAQFDGTKLIVMLGDYTDRGPQSAGVLDHLIASPPTGFDRLCLCGNHDAEMLTFMEAPDRDSPWLDLGGDATLTSYGLGEDIIRAGAGKLKAAVASHIPAEHRQFLEGLPALIETPDYVFVHAGLRPAVSLSDQSEEDLLWIRDGYQSDYAEFERVVVHGHTPVREPFVSPWRIGIDTGAFATGRLTAVRLTANNPPFLLETKGNRPLAQ